MLTLSAAAKLLKNTLHSDGAWLLLLEIQVAGLNDIIRVCRNTNDITWNGYTWIAFPFELGDISEDSKGTLPSVELKVSNVTRTLQYYIEQANGEAANYKVINCVKNVYTAIIEILEQDQSLNGGFEGEYFTYNDYFKLNKLKKNLKYKNINLDELRSIKDEEEIAHLRKAVNIADRAFEHILSYIKPGRSEIEVAVELEIFMRRLGSQKNAFSTIVASGIRGALPHGVATEKIICVGPVEEKQQQLYDFVLQAQLLGVKTLKPGVSGQFVDEVVRRYIMNGGYGQFFGHGLGHGVGLEIHEFPRLSPASMCDSLKPMMVVTVEPGVYLPGWGGIRIEDTVMVTTEGCEVLTKSSKHLIEIDLNL